MSFYYQNEEQNLIHSQGVCSTCGTVPGVGGVGEQLGPDPTLLEQQLLRVFKGQGRQSQSHWSRKPGRNHPIREEGDRVVGGWGTMLTNAPPP